MASMSIPTCGCFDNKIATCDLLWEMLILSSGFRKGLPSGVYDRVVSLPKISFSMAAVVNFSNNLLDALYFLCKEFIICSVSLPKQS